MALRHTVRSLFAAMALIGCADEGRQLTFNSDAGSPTDRGTPVADRGSGLTTDVPPVPIDGGGGGGVVNDNVRVYAHSSSELYSIDPRRLTVNRVGAFRWPSDGHDHRMTDIAVNAQDQMWGITYDAIYRVDSGTAACTFVAPFPGTQFNGLSFIPGGELEGYEVLVAANTSGGYFRVDTVTGQTSQLGSYGSGVGSSGDIVSVANGGTFATVMSAGEEYLARLDPRTGRATLIGETGQERTWGLGYWRQRVFGLTAGGNLVVIDIATGRASLVTSNGPAWWGAGVTTLSPTAPP